MDLLVVVAYTNQKIAEDFEVSFNKCCGAVAAIFRSAPSQQGFGVGSGVFGAITLVPIPYRAPAPV